MATLIQLTGTNDREVWINSDQIIGMTPIGVEPNVIGTEIFLMGSIAFDAQLKSNVKVKESPDDIQTKARMERLGKDG